MRGCRSTSKVRIIAKARQLIKLYEDRKIPRERVLIKIASTWEGLAAAEQLQKEGIRCNLTLMFSLVQAVRAAEAQVQLISPFVGRIYDWFKKENKRDYSPARKIRGAIGAAGDLHLLQEIRLQHRSDGRASFRNIGQIRELAGCDALTISPELMKELSESNEPLERKLNSEKTRRQPGSTSWSWTKRNSRWLLNDNAMAYEKTGEGIHRKFTADITQAGEIHRGQDRIIDRGDFSRMGNPRSKFPL